MSGIQQLVGKTIVTIDRDENDEELTFITSSGDEFRMYHVQACCEEVRLEDVDGDLNDILNSPVLLAEERTNKGEYKEDVWNCESTWTFYTIRTNKASVTLRWLGESNGCYSEEVEFEKVSDDED